MYRTTEVSSVPQGTVMAEMPSNKATNGAKATTIMVSLSATWDKVKRGSPLVRRLRRKPWRCRAPLPKNQTRNIAIDLIRR